MREIDRDDAFCISVLALGQLHHAVEAAVDERARTHRQATLDRASLLTAVPIPLADNPAQATAWLTTYGRLAADHGQRVGGFDRWILTSAIQLGLHVLTEDAELAAAAEAEGVAVTLMSSEPRGAP
jgi:predicted nucleic acid-binding protein